MKFSVITIFPKILDSYLDESFIKRALGKRLIQIDVLDLRKFTNDKRKKVDDRPFGGGPGMVLQVEPIYKAVQFVKRKEGRGNSPPLKLWRARRKVRVILFSTRGKKFDSASARRLSKYQHLILICGRYEGVDERVAKYVADEEISIGDYVLSGGELPALILIEAVSRFITGFLGKRESLEEVKGSYPVYTRPPKFFPEKFRRPRPWSVPEVLLSGDHKKIEKWRQ